MDSSALLLAAMHNVLISGNRLKDQVLLLSSYFCAMYTPHVDRFTSDRPACVSAWLDMEVNPRLKSPKHTSSYQGALGADDETITCAMAYNAAKIQFKDAVKHVLIEKKQRDTTVIHQLLKEGGLGRFQLKQVYRHIPILNEHPRCIGFSQACHNSKIKIAAHEAQKRLLEVGQGIHIDIQLQKLGAGPANLVIHQQTKSPLWLANISSFKKENNRVSNQRLFTSMPILYPQQSNQPNPDVYFSASRKNRRARTDKCLESDVFLPSIHAYRYQ